MTNEKGRKQVTILGVNADSTSKDGVLRNIRSKIGKGEKFFIVTPNPEQVLIARSDKEYREILNSADIAVPDGIGLIAAAKFYSLPRPKSFIRRALTLFVQGLGVGFSVLSDRDWLETELKLIKGREIFTELVGIAAKKGWSVVLLGDTAGSAQKAVKKLKENYFNLKVTAMTGPAMTDDGGYKSKDDGVLDEKLVKRINSIKPDILFIGFRAPIQEKWLYRRYNKLYFKCAMVVGGTLDYVWGKKPFPPKWIEDLNLEWLWRLIKRDQKMTRIIHAFPEFAWRIYWDKLTHKNLQNSQFDA